MLYEFADYTLDTQRYELRHTGVLSGIEPQVFDILAYLLAHRDRVVTRQELLEHVWPARFVSETTLDHRLMQARQVIGDNGQRQRFIKTIRGRGYRFVAAVQERAETPGLEAPEMAPASGTPLWRCERIGQEEAGPPPAVMGTAFPVRAPAPAVAAPLALPAMEGERKQVTVLCCTLADARARAARLGAAVMSGLVQRLGALAEPALAQFEGTIIHYGDNGFLALFGAPVAHEDHAWRAVLAASTLHQRLAAADAMHGLPPGESLVVCIGLHTGPVVIGSRGEASLRLDTAEEGTTAVATALSTLAEPGTILLSAVTQRLVQEEVQVESYGAITLDGSSAPVPVYAIHDIVRQRAGVPGRGGRVLSRFVGRQRELALLHERLAYAASGHGQVIGIAGEPGIGKSRLLNEFRQSLRGMALTYYAAHCFPYATATPYLPVRDLLRQMCGLADTDRLAAITAKISWALQEAGLDPETGTPVLLQLLDIPGAAERLASLSPAGPPGADLYAPVADVPALQSTTPVDPDCGEFALDRHHLGDLADGGGGTPDRCSHLASGDLSARVSAALARVLHGDAHDPPPSAVGGESDHGALGRTDLAAPRAASTRAPGKSGGESLLSGGVGLVCC
jgi:DNA-binding winged helix-turn-helix (wHTH) protein/class 3 adenylate cyclase